MLPIPIHIPTDSTYADPGSNCTTPKTAGTAQYTEETEDSLLDFTERSQDTDRNDTHPPKGRSFPVNKLTKAKMRVEQFIKDNELLTAHKELIRCVALSRIIYGDCHWRLAEAFANLAYGYLTCRGLPAQAKQHAESAKNILLGGVDMTKSLEEKRGILGTLVTIYYTLGMAHLLQNNGGEAYTSLQKVEKIVEELEELQEKSSVIGKISEKDIALALGRSCLLQKKFSSAMNYFERSAELVVSCEGDSSSELIAIYRDMAKTEQKRKKHDQAIHHLLQAHSICQAIYKPLSVESAQTGLLLAKAYAAPGDYIEMAEKYFTESLNVYRAVLGPDDPQTLTACVEFSKWLIQTGNTQEAYKLLHEAKGIEYNETVAEMLSIMGSICLADGKISKGYRLLKKCLEIQMAAFGSHHSKSRETQNLLSALQKSGAVRD
ncbi:tetratricopeptide repeat protein 23-like [Rana temporaria]|uniref:tetratricopeptide repeat protein 23-like n=1 Tax=Rana temporaria TaxID=8407 RepID=UPI001AADD4A6|nr:tetratricopeptide repeat protein 23-like [Rana temporaria]XP_040194135.1 tetratricopeptide repeat protein 23-like [Rana temporaria]